MLCSIYKSSKKEGTYLYLPKKDDFSQVPDTLMQMFGKPVFVMMIKMDGRQLAQVDIEKVKASMNEDCSSDWFPIQAKTTLRIFHEDHLWSIH